jgi:hypothetical protein
MQEDLEGWDALLEVFSTGALAQSSKEAFELALKRDLRAEPIYLNTAAIDEMRSSGKLVLVRDTKLRQQIGEIGSYHEWKKEQMSFPFQNCQQLRNTFQQYAVASFSDDRVAYDADTIAVNQKAYRAALGMKGCFTTIIRFHQKFMERTEALRNAILEKTQNLEV